MCRESRKSGWRAEPETKIKFNVDPGTQSLPKPEQEDSESQEQEEEEKQETTEKRTKGYPTRRHERELA